MISCNTCVHDGICANQAANDGCSGVCGFYEEQRPKSRWVESTPMSCGSILRWRLNVIEQKCESCGRWSVKWETTIPSNYCSYCGAKMSI
jgi:hypothetical protein